VELAKRVQGKPIGAKAFVFFIRHEMKDAKGHKAGEGRFFPLPPFELAKLKARTRVAAKCSTRYGIRDG